MPLFYYIIFKYLIFYGNNIFSSRMEGTFNGELQD